MNTALRRMVAFMVCLLMMAGAAINVNKSILGIELKGDNVSSDKSDDISDALTIDDYGNVIIDTSTLTDAKGFAGKTPLTIKINKDGVIEEITPQQNSESAGFFNRASALLENWKGKSAEEGISLKVDAVTGATMSSGALIDNMQRGLELYSSEINEINAKAASGGMPWKLWIALGVTIAACILPLFIKNRIYHTVQLLLNVLVLGFWCGQFISYRLMLSWLSSGFNMWAGLIPILMLIAAFVYPLFGKRQHYCSHICPLGSLQQLAGMCCKRKMKINGKLLKSLEWFRRILWAVLMLCLWIPVMTEWMDYELFSAFMVESASAVVLICGAAVAILSFFISRPYCRFICPTGTLMKVEEKMGDNA